VYTQTKEDIKYQSYAKYFPFCPFFLEGGLKPLVQKTIDQKEEKKKEKALYWWILDDV